MNKGDNMKQINITNGEVFDQYFKENFKEKSVPFNEVMMDGKLRTDYFSEAFIEDRIKVLDTTKQIYLEKLNPFLKVINDIGDYDEVNLWFGDDTFCQINQLFILSMLESRSYLGKITIYTLDSLTHLNIINKYRVKLEGFTRIYNDLIHEKEIKTTLPYLEKAVQLYYDYKNPKGVLQTYAKENKLLPMKTKINALMDIGKPYGLSDVQAQKIIDK